MGETSDGKNGNRNTKNGKNNSGAFSSLFQQKGNSTSRLVFHSVFISQQKIANCDPAGNGQVNYRQTARLCSDVLGIR